MLWRDAYVIMIAACVLVPSERQAIGNHLADWTVTNVTEIILD